MSTAAIADRFFNGSIRAEQIVWLAANLDNPCDALDELIEEGDPAEVAALLGVTEAQVRAAWDSMDFETLMAKVRRYGFLVRASTPMPQSFSKDSDGYTSYGWGSSTSRWFYTESFDEAFVETLFKWQKGIIEGARRSFFAKERRSPKKKAKQG